MSILEPGSWRNIESTLVHFIFSEKLQLDGWPKRAEKTAAVEYDSWMSSALRFDRTAVIPCYELHEGVGGRLAKRKGI